MPNTVPARIWSCGASHRVSSLRAGGTAVTARNKAKTQVCTRSGGIRNSTRRSARYIKRSSLQAGLVRNAGRLFAAQQHAPAAVGVQPHAGELPAAVFGLDRQPG